MRLFGAAMRRSTPALAIVLAMTAGAPIPGVRGASTGGSITIVQDTVPDDSTDFAFTTDFGQEFSLDDDADATLPATATFSTLQPGTYSFTQGPNTYWKLGYVDCAGAAGAVDVNGSTVSVEIVDSEAVTCTFATYRATGTLVVNLDTIPDTGIAVNFGGDFDPFVLDDDPATATSSTRTFGQVPWGTWNLDETVPNGLQISGIQCTDPDNGTTAAGVRAVIDLDPGETVSCTFTNVAVTPTCQGMPATIVVRPGSGPVKGTNGDDVIVALSGDATIDGRRGNDLICTGDGNDTIVGGAGDDWISAGAGNDTIDAGSENDVVYGDDGADTIQGGRGLDSLSGGPGDDVIDGGRDYDSCESGGGSDTFSHCEA